MPTPASTPDPEMPNAPLQSISDVIYIESTENTLTIDGFCRNKFTYIIHVAEQVAQHQELGLICDGVTLVITVEHEAEYTLKLSQSSEEILNRNVVSNTGIDISMLDGAFPDSVEMCFPLSKDTEKDEACLGYWDDSKSPAEWVCEDVCLKNKKNRFCGSTDHFTNFAILLYGGADECEKDYYVTGSFMGDMLLVWLLIALFILIWIVLIFLCSHSKIRVYFVGKETHRIRALRSSINSNSK